MTFCPSIPTSPTALVDATLTTIKDDGSSVTGDQQPSTMSGAPSPGTSGFESGSGSGPEPKYQFLPECLSKLQVEYFACYFCRTWYQIFIGPDGKPGPTIPLLLGFPEVMTYGRLRCYHAIFVFLGPSTDNEGYPSNDQKNYPSKDKEPHPLSERKPVSKS
ncbi:hypothetical protein AgCh_034901 [Apium graveolens]